MIGDDDAIRCYYCGNEGTAQDRLGWGDTDAGRVPIHADDDCPPLLDGWAACVECSQAAPMSALIAVSPVVVHADGSSEASPRRAQAYVCRGTCNAKRPFAMSLGGDVHRVPHPVAGHKHPIAAPPKAPRDEDTDGDQTTADQARCDAVPTDGDGLDVSGLSALWGTKDSTTRAVVGRLVKAGAMRYEEVPTRVGGAPKKVYWRVDR